MMIMITIEIVAIIIVNSKNSLTDNKSTNNQKITIYDTHSIWALKPYYLGPI